MTTGVSVSVSVKKGEDNYYLAVSGKNPKGVIASIKAMVQELQKEDAADKAAKMKVTNV